MRKQEQESHKNTDFRERRTGNSFISSKIILLYSVLPFVTVHWSYRATLEIKPHFAALPLKRKCIVQVGIWEEMRLENIIVINEVKLQSLPFRPSFVAYPSKVSFGWRWKSCILSRILLSITEDWFRSGFKLCQIRRWED